MHKRGSISELERIRRARPSGKERPEAGTGAANAMMPLRGFCLVAIMALAACVGEKSTQAPAATGSAAALPQQLSGRLKYSFVDEFPHGVINSRQHVSTPTGVGALVASWPFGVHTVRSLTVLASFRYTYHNVAILDGETLTFVAAKPYPQGAVVSAFVDISSKSGKSRVFRATLDPASSGGPKWTAAAIPLKRFANQHLNVTFGADALNGNADASWVAFGKPAILSDAHM